MRALRVAALLVVLLVTVAAQTTAVVLADDGVDADGGVVALPPPVERLAAPPTDAPADRSTTNDADDSGDPEWQTLHRGRGPPPLVTSTMAVEGSPAVGEAVPLAVTVTAREPLTDATVTLPDYRFVAVSDRRFEVGDLAAGESATLSLSATPLANVSQDLAFTLVATSEGRPVTVTVVHDLDLFAPGLGSRLLQVDAPATSPGEEPSASLDGGGSTLSLASSHEATVTGRLVYENPDGSTAPLRDVTVKLMDDDFVNSVIVSGGTDDDGRFSFTFEPQAVDNSRTATVFLRVEARNVAGYVTGGPLSGIVRGTTNTFPVNAGTTSDRGTLSPNANMPAWQALDWALDEYRFLHDEAGWIRGPIEMQYPQGDWPVYSYSTGFDGVVDANQERIELPDRSDAGWNRGTILHEYAHAVHMAMYDYEVSNRPSKGSYECHFIQSETDAGFATVEGFAEFMQAIVDEDPSMLQSAGQNVETNTWYDLPDSNLQCSNDDPAPDSDSGDFDGNDVEGSFASILYDAVDDRNETGDDIDHSFEYVFDVLDDNDVQSMADFWRHYPGDRNALARTFFEYGILRPDGYEPNDAFWSAASLGDQSRLINPYDVDAILADGNDDYYRVRLSPGTVLNTSLTFDHNESDLTLTAYAPDQSMLRFAASNTDNESLGLVARQNGTYYLRVSGQGSAAYRLTVLTEPAPPDDLYEENDGGGSNAATVQVGTYERLYARSVLDDSDFYAFDVDARSMVEVDLGFDHADSDLALVARGPGLSTVRSDSSTDDETVRFYAEQAGTYEVGVLGDRNGIADYELRWYVEGERDASLEPNDDRASAWSASPPTTYTDYHLPPGDTDVYAVDAQAGDPLNVTITYEGGRPDVRVLDDAGGVVDTLPVSPTDDGSVVTLPRDGTYYVEVAHSGGPWTEYTLSLDVGVGPGTTGWRNNGFGSATPLSPGWYGDLQLTRTDDSDYFAVDATAGDVVSVRVYFPDNATRDDVLVDAYDPNETHLEAGQTDGDDEYVVFQAGQNGTYYVRTETTVDRTVSYDIGLSRYRNDEYEPNDDVASAPYLLGNTSLISLVEGETDAYAFYVRANETLTTYSSFLYDRGTTDLRIVDGNGTTLASVTSDGSWTWLNYTASTTGTVYLLVEPQSTFTDIYRIVVDGAGLPPSILENVDQAERYRETVTLADEADGEVEDEETDTYLVDLAADQRLNLTIPPTVLERLDLRLVGPDGEPLATGTEALSYTTDRNGTYRLRVASATGEPTTYELVAGRVWVDSDRYEVNDDRKTAAPLPPGDYDGLALSQADRDYYAVSLVRGQVLRVGLDAFEGDGPVELAVLNPEGEELAARVTSGDEKLLVVRARFDGPHYVRVRGIERGTAARYGLTVALSLPENDRLEPNDGPETAVPLEAGTLTDLAIAAGDRDTFRVDLDRGATLTTALAFDQAAGDLDVVLTGPKGQVVAQSAGERDGESFRYTAATAGTYYLTVTGRRGASATYDLSTELAPPLADDRYEENDRRETASEVKIGTHRDLRVLGVDVDVFAVDLSKGETLRTHLAFPVADGDLDVAVYGPEGTPLGAGRTTTDDETVTVTALRDGTHYVRVAPVGQAWTTYTMTLETGVDGPAKDEGSGLVSVDASDVDDGDGDGVDDGLSPGDRGGFAGRPDLTARDLPAALALEGVGCRGTWLCDSATTGWLVGNERVGVYVTGVDGERYTYFARVRDGQVTRFEWRDDLDDQRVSVNVYTDEATVGRVLDSQTPTDELRRAYDAGDVRIQPVSFGLGLKLFVFGIVSWVGGVVGGIVDFFAGIGRFLGGLL